MRRRSTSAPLAPLLCAALALPACAQRNPPFLQPAEPDCEMDKVTAILQDTNAACDQGFYTGECDAPCAVQMAALVHGQCAKTVTGIVDQQDPVPNGLAEKIDTQWARCLAVNVAALTALIAERSCSGGGGGGGHRRLQSPSAEALLEAYAAGDGSVCALLVSEPSSSSSLTLTDYTALVRLDPRSVALTASDTACRCFRRCPRAPPAASG